MIVITTEDCGTTNNAERARFVLLESVQFWFSNPRQVFYIARMVTGYYMNLSSILEFLKLAAVWL